MAAVPSSELTQAQKDELLCTYAALILHDEGAEMTPDNMNKLIKASGSSVEAYWPTLFCKILPEKEDLAGMLKLGGGGGGGGGAAGGGGDAGGGGGAAPAAAAAPEEEEEDMDFDLFD